MKPRQLVLLPVLFTGVSASVEAAVLNFQPPSQAVPAASTLQISLTVSGLAVGTAPSVGVFDLDLTYNPSILQFNSVSFGDPGLGDQLDLTGFGSVTSVDGSVAGVVNHFELSLDAPGDLDTMQAGAFTLSVFSFTALAPGVSALDLVVNAFGDSLGDPLSVTVTPGSVTVVPEPTAGAVVLGIGMIAWFGVRRLRDH